ncbi:MAG: hypothetical protein V3T83_19190 [Acidobacteriota bacterium]
MAVGRRCIHAGGTRLLRCSPGYACIAEHRQRGASTPLVFLLFFSVLSMPLRLKLESSLGIEALE